MAQPADTHSTYDQIGIREDLSDVIHNISPMQTPFLTMAKRGTAKNTLFEWQTDSLASADTSNARIEGDDATTTAAVATTRLNNQTQIVDKVPRVSGTADAVTTAGRRKEMAYQVMKMTKEIKRDIEAILLDNNAKVAGNDSTARETAGVPSWIATNESVGTGGVAPTGDGTDARTDGTQRAFLEAQLKTVLSAIWDEGGDPTVVMVGSFNKQAMSGFDGGTTKFDKSEDKRLTAAIDVYVSDFGELKVIPNRFQRARDALVLDMDYWKVNWLRPLRNTPLAKTGDTERRQIIGEFGLEACQEAASGIVADLTTS